ncbi:Transcriptional adapter 2 [Mycena indigotica]|uniref:Transcriptional adapter 2 n=1 Tax=Mycena indigotica TaxID=2126181 RepID=A0A8H6W6C0_9AGAR|nr:Transcriptional adapter 2 [Mycena indigotica]KAF7306527.1 Transcriptional adapter 2 [Mycena indigotica]
MVTQRKTGGQAEDIYAAVTEPGVQFECDACACDLTHTIRIKCADPVCQSTDGGVDICPPCFCQGKEFGNHLRGHAYRVIEFNSYPIFSEDWGADEELLLLKGIQSQGLGNWKKIAEHVGTQSKEEVEKHYNSVYVDSPNWPMPLMDRKFEIAPEEFQERKRRRISELNEMPIPPAKPAPTSAPAVHEIATFLPGRLEFEHEFDNEAEELVKDIEFGVVLQYGGDQIPEDENDLDVKARIKWEEDRRNGLVGQTIFMPERKAAAPNGKGPAPHTNGINTNGDSKAAAEDVVMGNGTANTDDDDEPTVLPPIETDDSLKFKLTLLETYFQRLEKRWEHKVFMFDRGLLEYKKIQAAEKKRVKEDKDILHRLRPFARLQTGDDYEAFSNDILYEHILRKKIQDLQQHRRLGLSTSGDIEKYIADLGKRTQTKATSYYDKNRRQSSVADRGSIDDEMEAAPKPEALINARKRAPLNLANSPSLHLLTPAEQALCSTLRILPKPYLVVKETLVREYARRGGKLRRREARDLVKIDVNKTSRVWDFLVQAGFLQINAEANVANSQAHSASSVPPSVASSQDNSVVPSTTPSQTTLNGSTASPVISSLGAPGSVRPSPIPHSSSLPPAG